MTIDPENFEAQGAPTREIAKRVWEEAGRPGARPLAAILEQRGYKVSWRTLARWKEKDPEWSGKPTPEKKPAPRRDVLERPYESSGKIVEIVRAGIQDEVDIIDARIKELLGKSEAELDVIEQKSRKILNIVLTEAGARRANVMMLIPKDTALFVQAMTEASKATLTGGLEQLPKTGDPRVIDGELTDVTPSTPLQDAIRKFKREKELT